MSVSCVRMIKQLKKHPNAQRRFDDFRTFMLRQTDSIERTPGSYITGVLRHVDLCDPNPIKAYTERRGATPLEEMCEKRLMVLWKYYNSAARRGSDTNEDISFIEAIVQTPEFWKEIRHKYIARIKEGEIQRRQESDDMFRCLVSLYKQRGDLMKLVSRGNAKDRAFATTIPLTKKLYLLKLLEIDASTKELCAELLHDILHADTILESGNRAVEKLSIPKAADWSSRGARAKEAAEARWGARSRRLPHRTHP